MSGFVDAHRDVWGHRPALFKARWSSECCWCGDNITPGDKACYWPEHNAALAHEACLRIVTEAGG